MSKLYFRLGDMEGFASNKLANKKIGFSVPIRELIQNSLDARKAENEPCKIDIYIETIAKEDIPHIEEYEETLKNAINTQQSKNSYNEKARQVVELIENALEKDELDILMFVDNGKGMPQDKLEGLLDERSIQKEELSIGSYGAGHLSSYFLSSLQYILYATKYNKDGSIENLFTGSPILAGHSDKHAYRGSKGRIVQEIPDEKKPQFIFPTDFPYFIQEKMKKLKSTGSMVVILGLSESWSNEAEYAIASNFFHAMAYADLNISVHNEEKKTIINDDTKIRDLIEQKKKKKRKVSHDILSGGEVYHAYHAVMEGEQKKLELDNGDKVNVSLKNDIDSNSGIVLIRNGMVIARHDSMLSTDMKNLRKNDDYRNFMVVIDVDQRDSPELFKLIKGAESPHHNKLETNRCSTEKEKELRTLLKKLSEKLKECLVKINREGFDLNLPLLDIPSLADIKGGGANSKKSGQSSTGRIKLKETVVEQKSDNKNGKKNNKRKKPEISVRRLEYKNAMRYSRNGENIEINMRVIPTKQPDSKDNVYLSIAIAEDNDKDTVKEFVAFENLSINGEPISAEHFIRPNENKERCLQVKLGKLNKEEIYNITSTVNSPPGFENAGLALEPMFSLKRR